MVAATSLEFLERFPDFCNHDPDLIDTILQEVEALYCPSPPWDDPVRQRSGVLLRTAHYFEVQRLQMAVTASAGASPEMGTTPSISSIADDLDTTTYGRQFKALRKRLPVTGFAF